MDKPRVATEINCESMRIDLEGLLGEVMEGVNEVIAGRVIVESVEQVRQLMHKFRRRANE